MFGIISLLVKDFEIAIDMIFSDELIVNFVLKRSTCNNVETDQIRFCYVEHFLVVVSGSSL